MGGRWFTLVLMVPLALAYGPARGSEGAVYNLHLYTDNGPDCTDLESFVSTATEGATTPQEKCIAIWRWARQSRRQTSCAQEEGRLIWDPILHYNSYGTMNCGVISGLNIACFLQLGYRGRYIQLGDHTVSEVSWDEGQSWHLFDTSMSFYCFNHEGVVASCEEIRQAHGCELSGGKSEPGHYYLYHGAPACTSHLGPGGWRYASDQPVAYKRTLINGASSYTDGFSVSQYTQYARSGRRYVLNLLPGQSYTRYWTPLDRQRAVPDEQKPDYYRPLADGDPDDQHGLNNIRGNGEWIFRPDLESPDCRNLFYDCHALETASTDSSAPNVHPQRAGEPAAVTFQVSAANVITSMRIQASARHGKDDTLAISVSRTGGIDWLPVWKAEATGSEDIRLNLRDEVAGVTECLVRLEMLAKSKKTDVGLDRLKLTTLTQVNRRTLPKLTLGTNRVRLRADEQEQTTTVWPVLHGGRYRETVFAEHGVHCTDKADGIYKATLGSAVNGEPCSATWRLELPTDVTALSYGVVATNRSSSGYVSVQHSFDGEQFAESFRKSDGAFPFDKQVLRTVEGATIPPGTRQAQVKCEFFSRGGAGTYGMEGIQDLWMRVRHAPRIANLAPLEVTYNWTEHRASGDVTRSHTQVVHSLPCDYTINTSGYRDPTMNWIRVNLAGSAPVGEVSSPGYSDGEDVGSGREVEPVRYEWGTNLAKGRSYTTSRPSSERSKNGDSGGVELTNGVVIAPTDYATSDAVQSATAFWEDGDPLVIVVDLAAEKNVAGVRVCTHQPNAQYCHPAHVAVALSRDGKTWTEAGTIHHNDLWKPPADYEAWEHDDDPSYQDLPAQGRLAYRYPLAFDDSRPARYVRFTCTPLEGRGMGLSEVQVFDHAQVVRKSWNKSPSHPPEKLP